MKIAVDCVDSLLRGKELSDSDVVSLKASLDSKKVQDLQKIAVEVPVRLTGSNWLSAKEWYSRQFNQYG